MKIIRTILTYGWVALALVAGIPLRKKCQKRMETDQIAGDKELHGYAQIFARKLLQIAGVTLEVQGKENIPQTEPVVFIGNHQSLMDIAVIIVAVDRPIGFLAKAELGKVKLIGDWILSIRSVFIERGETRKGLEAIIQCAKIVKSGHGMVVYPEGTRTRDGSLGEFKAGSMKIAQRGGACIVPVAIKGAFEAMPPNKIWIQGGKITLYILPAMPYEEIKGMDTTSLAQEVKSRIGAKL